MPPRGYRKEKPTFKCELCSYTSQRQSCFTDHLRVHSGEKPYKCDECGKGFTQKSNLGQHMKVHGGGAKHEFKCDRKGCNFTSKWKSSLLIHERWHDGERPYQCTLCEKTFTQSTHCRTHMRESHGNERKFKCSVCSKSFKRSDHLTRHMAFHKAEKNYACEVCGKRFIDMGGLRSHRRIHEGESGKRYKCDKCPYKSFFKQCLDVHYRIHLGLKPYECDHCGKTFRTSSSVKIHIRMVHQGEEGKIFSCELCSFSTANKQSLKNHHRRIHLGYKERAWLKCLACGKVYTTRSSYYSHRRKRHPKLPRVDDIYRPGHKLNNTKDKSQQLTPGGRLTSTNRKTGGSTGTTKGGVTNIPNIGTKDIVNIKTKGNKIENITVKVSNGPASNKNNNSSNSNNKRGRKRAAGKAKDVVEVVAAASDLQKLKDVADIVSGLETSPKPKYPKVSETKVKKQDKMSEKSKPKGNLKVKLKIPAEKTKKKPKKNDKEKKEKKDSKTTKRKKPSAIAADNQEASEEKTEASPPKKKRQARKKKETEGQGQAEVTLNKVNPVPDNAAKVNKRKSASPRKSTGPRFSPLAIPERGFSPEPITDASPGSEERLVQVAPVLTMKAYNSEGRPIHVKFVPVLAQSGEGESSSSLTSNELCESIQKQALDIAARVKDELVSSGVRVSSTSTEDTSDYLSPGQSPIAKQINISPLLPQNSVLNSQNAPREVLDSQNAPREVLNSQNAPRDAQEVAEENNNDLIPSEPLDLSLSATTRNNSNNSSSNSNNNSSSNNKSEVVSTDTNSNHIMDYDPENVLDITPIEYPSGRKVKDDGWVVPERNFRKRGRPPKPMKEKTIAVADPSRVISSMVINVDLQHQPQNA